MRLLKKTGFLTFSLAIVSILLVNSFAAAQDLPPEEKDKRNSDLLELIKLDNTIKLDIRYARTDNFVGKAVYPEARAFLQRPAAEALMSVHKKLAKQSLGLVIFDGYRPWAVTKLFWEVTSEDLRKFVADPKKGSRHNRGCAVDLSIYELKTDKLVPMPSDFDEFTERASPNYEGGTKVETANRDLLRKLMEAEGFTVNKNEWWHFDYKDWEDYAIYDIAFSQIRNLEFPTEINVRHVEFAGNNTTRDRTVRGNIFLSEGDIFTKANLAKSIKKLNESKLFEKISELDVSWFVNQNGSRKFIDFVFFLREKPKK